MDILYHHVAERVIPTTRMIGSVQVQTLAGDFVTLEISDLGTISVDNAVVVTPDLLANNGIVHVIDRILLPQLELPTRVPSLAPIAMPTQPPEMTTGIPTLSPSITSEPLIADPSSPTMLPTSAPSNTMSPTPLMPRVRLSLMEVIAQTFALQSLDAYMVFAGVLDEITGDGPFTMMTPWDGAWESLEESWTLKLQNETYNAHLVNLLRYHILDTDLPLNELQATQTLTMRNGEDIVMEREVDTLRRVRVNGILVLAPYDATNGYAYMLDKVLRPAWFDMSLVDVATATPSLSTLTSLVVIADLEAVLADESAALTVIAPTNDAFANLGQDTIDFSLSDAGQSVLQETLLYHVIEGPHPSLLFGSGPLRTVQGEEVSFLSGTPNIVQGITNQATILLPDQVAMNGVAHVVDEVLLLEPLN